MSGATMQGPVSSGLPVLALGFRPFYLLGAGFAAVAVPLWVLAFAGHITLPGLIFGFAAAILTGFLLTAVRNWSGLPTANGAALAALAGLWCLGRLALATGPAVFAAVVDLLFLPTVAVALAGPLIRSGQRRNLPLVAIVLLLALLNLGFHLGQLGVLDLEPAPVFAAAILLFVLIMTVIGGRVVPMFTRNSLTGARLRSWPLVDRLAIAATVLAALLGIAAIGIEDLGPWPAATAAVAAIAQAVRLWSWAPLATWRIPLLWVLHAGYAWIPLGFALQAAVGFGAEIPPSLPLHAFAVGAMSSLMLGMMTRSARGHTARPLVAGGPETLAFLALQLAALTRIAVPLIAPGLTAPAALAAGLLWSLAFAVFVVVYWPILTRPRLDGKPG